MIAYEQRRALVGHMPTQVLYGERVVVLERQGAWTKIAVPDQPSPLDPRGYPGLGASAGSCARAATAGKLVTVTAPKREALERPRGRASARSCRSSAKRREVARRPDADRRACASARRRREAAPAHASRPRPQREAVPRPAYLWGGLSAWGYDCSGLTWAVYRAHGITIPRDADAQVTAGRAISLEDAKPGDLIFYGTSFVHHVTMDLGRGQMIEAPNSASEVRIVPIRTDDFAGVRTYL